MHTLTPGQETAFKRIMNHIKENDSLNIDIYSEIVPACAGLSALNEQYYSQKLDQYCYRDMSSCNGNIFLYLKNRDREEISIRIFPLLHDIYAARFFYVYDESGPDDEWYVQRPHWNADFSLKLYNTEEEYFQQSTVQDVVFTKQENDMFLKFNNNFNELISKRYMEIINAK